MSLSQEQFDLLVTKADLEARVGGLATRQQVSELIGTVSELAATVRSFLHEEWTAHRHFEHPIIDGRLRTIEDHLGLKSGA